MRDMVTASICRTARRIAPSESYTSYAEAPMLTRADMIWFCGHYARSEEDINNLLVSPLVAADLDGLPRALIVTAEFDPLRDEAEDYAARLRAVGAFTTTRRYDVTTDSRMDFSTKISSRREPKRRRRKSTPTSVARLHERV